MFTNKSGSWVTFDRHLNTSSSNVIRSIQTAKDLVGSHNVRVSYKHPLTCRYCKPSVGCFVEIDIRKSAILPKGPTAIERFLS